MEYDSKIEAILKLLDNPLENDGFVKSLKLIIDLRTDIITTVLKNYSGFDKLEKYTFLLDQIDRLYTNKYEQTRIDTFQKIAENK